jgi:hypothetical protein
MGFKTPSSSFWGLFTRELMGNIFMRPAGNGFSNSLRSPFSSSPNHFAWCSSGRIMGIRVFAVCRSRFVQRVERVTASETPRGIVVTSHARQGKTVAEVIVNAQSGCVILVECFVVLLG